MFNTSRWLNAAPTLAERTRRRVALHLIPYLFFLYILAFLDRANVSVAALGMTESIERDGLGFTNRIIGIGTGMFFWGYWILEIPSTVSVLKWGARWVFVRILVLWGLSCTFIGMIGLPIMNDLFWQLPDISENADVLVGLDTAVDFAFGWTARLFDPEMQLYWLGGLAHFNNNLYHSPEYQFYFFRFMLGFFEGGFFPSVIVYLSLWFRPEDRAKAIASFMSAIPLSLLLGSPLSGLMLQINWLGMPGWRWVFILQGIVPVFAGFATIFFLPDRPNKAPWLPPDERDWLMGELEREHKGKEGHAHGHFLWLSHVWLVLLLTAAYFCLNVYSYGVITFMPKILKDQTGLDDFWTTVLTAVPYTMALIAMLVNGWHSDRTRERIGHVTIPLCTMGLFLALTGFCYGMPVWPILLLTVFVGMFMFAHLPAYWPIPTMFLGSLAAASATGFINMIGNLGGTLGPYVVGSAVTRPVDSATGAANVAGLVGAGLADPSGGPAAGASAVTLLGAAVHEQPDYAQALLILAAFPVASGLIVLLIGLFNRNKLMARKS